MLKRFILAFVAFVGLIVPGTLIVALLAARPAKPTPFQPPGCIRHLDAAGARVTAARARLRALGEPQGAQTCKLTRLYFLEVVTARAVTALCERGPQRERALVRLDADVTHINNSIAVACN